MIEFVLERVRTLVLEPQGEEERGESRAYLPDVPVQIGTEAQALDLLTVTTVPVSTEIGGGMTLRHSISVAVVAQHGDQAEAMRLRNKIVTEIVLRYVDSEVAMRQTDDPATGQYVTRLTWSIDWRPLNSDTLNASATVSFIVDTQLDR